jgi:protein-tyrosine kinase
MSLEHFNDQHLKLVTIYQPQSSAAEAFKTLRANIDVMNSNDDFTSIVVTSSKEGEGKTLTATNLAVAFAQSGKRTIYIDADLRRPAGHLTFQLPNDKGLTSFLEGESKLTEIVLKTGLEQLYIIPSGPKCPNPSELLASERMEVLLEKASSKADYIIIDSPPLNVADSTTLAALADSSLLVLDTDNTPRAKAKASTDHLKVSSHHILGVFINRWNAEDNEG